MRILLIRNYPSYMEVVDNTYNIQEIGLAKSLIRRGHICDVLFWTDGEPSELILPVDNIGILHVYYRRGITFLKNTVFYACQSLLEQYDILQACEYNQMQSWFLAGRYPKKTIIYHGPYYSPFNVRYNLVCRAFDLLFLKRYIRKDTPFLAKSTLAEEFLSEKGIAKQNLTVMGVGIDAQMLSGPDMKCQDLLYKIMQKDTSPLKLLYVGKLERRRNIIFLLDVFSKVVRAEPLARLYMIGDGDDEYITSIQGHIEDLGIGDNIVRQSKMQQKYLSEIYRMADYFLLTTEYEIFGMVLLEAMYYGNIVLTTRNGGSQTLIEDGVNGFILDMTSAEPWAERILSTYRDRDQKKMVQSAARETIEKYYTWDDLAPQFECRYEEMLNHAELWK